VCYEKRDAINRIHVFKKDDVVGIEFKKIVELRDVPNECAEVLDESLVYGRQYTYRVFVENIHGMISAPTEITLFAVVNKILAKSRYNSLKNPIFNAQTQKGKASITINANDKRILYYTIERRDITIGEKKFIVPTLETNKYGGKGWSFNSLFVNGQQTIRFVDDTTTNDHVYEYKIIGVDAYGNKSSDSRMLVKVEQGVLRAPINALVIVDRERPLSLKISWEDDNGLSNSPGAVLNTSEQSPNARPRPRTRTATEVENSGEPEQIVFYEVQRRKAGEITWQSFPFTMNRFLIEEEPASDNIDFYKNQVLNIDDILQKRKDVAAQRIADMTAKLTGTRGPGIPSSSAPTSGERTPAAPPDSPNSSGERSPGGR